MGDFGLPRTVLCCEKSSAYPSFGWILFHYSLHHRLYATEYMTPSGTTKCRCCFPSEFVWKSAPLKNILGIQSWFSRLKIVILGHSRKRPIPIFRHTREAAANPIPIKQGRMELAWGFSNQLDLWLIFPWYSHSIDTIIPLSLIVPMIFPRIFPRIFPMMDNSQQPVNVTYFSFMTRMILLRAATKSHQESFKERWCRGRIRSHPKSSEIGSFCVFVDFNLGFWCWICAGYIPSGYD